MKKQSEHQLQRTIFEWVRLQAKTDARYEMIYAIPNGARTSIGTAVKLKAEGLTKGVFDICVDVPRMPYHGLKIEVKTPDGVMSPEQNRRAFLNKQFGYLSKVVRSFEEFQLIIETYFEGKWLEKSEQA